MDSIISDLNVNFDSSNPNDYIDILNKISLSTEECVDNLGAYADITSVELHSEMIVSFRDEYVNMNVYHGEAPGPKGDEDINVMSPNELVFEKIIEIEKGLQRDGIPQRKPHWVTKITNPMFFYVLGKTVVEHDCPTQILCKECMGSGRCRHCGGDGHNECSKCHGEGSEICRKCGGSGYCRRCNGSGEVTCTECGGKGWKAKYDGTTERCWKCSGKGMIECPDCGFLYRGKCRECNGRGEVTCSKCYGLGENPCSECHSTGVCANCQGQGNVVCPRCEGSGVYKTYDYCVPNIYTAETMGYLYFSDCPNSQLEKADKETIFDGVVVKEKQIGINEYDKSGELLKLIQSSFPYAPNASGDYSERYEILSKEYEVPEGYCLYQKSSKIFLVPSARVKYKVNDKDYELLILGKNGVISTESFPTIINEVKDNMIQRFLKSVTRRKRLVSYIKLAAYICQSDGVDVSESRLLNAFINKLKYNKQKEETFKSELSKYNSKYLPYVELRKEIKSLFVSKKMLSFAWQCMSVDKKHSEQEKVLFDTLCQELKVTNPQELEKLERFAERFARLDNEMIVEEYLK